MQQLMTSKQVLHFMNGTWLGKSIAIENRFLLARMLFLIYMAHLEETKMIRGDIPEFAGIPERVTWRLVAFSIERKWIKVERGLEANRHADYVYPTKSLIHMIESELREIACVAWNENA
jgi:hypothetical protein